MGWFEDIDQAAPPPGAPTWGNQGGTPESDPWQNYATQAATPPATVPAPTQVSPEDAINAFWSAVTQQGKTAFSDQELANYPGVTRISADKFQLPNGQMVDIIRDAGGANAPAWHVTGGQPGQNGQAPAGGGGGVPGAGAGGFGGAGAGLPAGTSGLASTYSAGTSPLDVPAFTEEFKYDPWTRKFIPPTGESVTQDPGYQFRLSEGQKAVERGASSKGTLNTGGTLKDVSQFGQNLASQEYGQAYGRAMNEYGSDYNDYLGGYGRALGEYGQKAGIFGQNYQRGLQGFQAAQQVDQFGRSLAQNESQFGRNLGQQNEQFGRNLDYGYAGLGANTIMGGSRDVNNEYTSAADAAAAGQVGSSNAWNQAIGSGANLAQILALGRAGARGPSFRMPFTPGVIL